MLTLFNLVAFFVALGALSVLAIAYHRRPRLSACAKRRRDLDAQAYKRACERLQREARLAALRKTVRAAQ